MYDKKGDVKNGSSKLESSKTEIAKNNENGMKWK
jgi:hypothetical protein